LFIVDNVCTLKFAMNILWN